MKTSPLSVLSLSLLLFLSLLSPSLSQPQLCNSKDETTLLKIKNSFNNPNLLPSWNPNTTCCDWEGIECDVTTSRVIGLSLFGLGLSGGLSGHIPAAVADLPFLQTLMFQKLPKITGEIPSAIAKLKHLKMLTLSSTDLSGHVPSSFSKLKNLTLLDLSFNKLTGSIPPELAKLTNLDAIRLDGNKLTGSIPKSLGTFTGKTPDLNLSHNQLTGTVPKSLGQLNFTTLDFSRNKLSGDLSFIFGSNKTIQIANFSTNKFDFDLSNVVFPVSLTSLDLNHNKIFGSLPAGLTALNLQSLNVSYNSLCGQIPIGGKLQSFPPTSYFHNLCLCGAPLPPCMLLQEV